MILLLTLAGAPVATGATIRSGAINPATWDRTETVAVSWIQDGLAGTSTTSTTVEINAAADGTTSGAWITYDTVQPVTDGAVARVIDVSALEGRHLVRVRAHGLPSPLSLTFGPLLLDRTAPRVTDPSIVAVDDRADVGFTVDDEGRSGVDPDVPTLVEYQSASGWHPADRQPTPDSGRKTASITTAGLADGTYPVRVTATDHAGNSGRTEVGSIVVDRTPPVIGTPTVTAVPTIESPLVGIAFSAGDDGSGLDPVTPPVAINVDTGAVMARAEPGASSVTVPLPGPGTYRIAVRVTDRAGRVSTSPPITVVDPRPAVDAPKPQAPPVVVEEVRLVPQVQVRRAAPLTSGERWAWNEIQRFHRTRAIPLRASLITARTPAQWVRTVGGPTATATSAYTTFTGIVAVGPAASRGLNQLATLRRCRTCRITNARARLIVDSLAVTLHESLHATGARAPADQATPEGRAFEEAFTEAATFDLLPRLIRSMAVPPRVRAALLRQVPRVRPRYPRGLAWARGLSTTATGRPYPSAPAVRWRIAVADTWGPDRWSRLATSTRRHVDDLRASAPVSG